MCAGKLGELWQHISQLHSVCLAKAAPVHRASKRGSTYSRAALREGLKSAAASSPAQMHVKVRHWAYCTRFRTLSISSLVSCQNHVWLSWHWPSNLVYQTACFSQNGSHQHSAVGPVLSARCPLRAHFPHAALQHVNISSLWAQSEIACCLFPVLAGYTVLQQTGMFFLLSLHVQLPGESC